MSENNNMGQVWPFSKWIRLNLTHEVRMRCAAVTKQNIIISEILIHPIVFEQKKSVKLQCGTMAII